MTVIFVIWAFSFLLPNLVSGQHVNQTLHIGPVHPGIQYNGRWVFKDTTEAQAEWQGSSITVWVESNRVEAILDGGSEITAFIFFPLGENMKLEN